jgi:hypothetical protein
MKKSKNIFLVSIILLFVLAPQFVTAFQKNNSDALYNFISTLKLSHFPNCAIFFFRHNNGNDYFSENVLPNVVSRMEVVAYYSIRHNSSEIGLRFPIQPVNSYNRKAPVCKLAIITFGQYDGNKNDEALAKIRT